MKYIFGVVRSHIYLPAYLRLFFVHNILQLDHIASCLRDPPFGSHSNSYIGARTFF